MGLTRVRAEQISDIDYKQAVRVITLTNVTLSLGAPSQVDSVNLSQGDRVLVAGQSTGAENGIYRVASVGTGSNGTWERSDDANVTGEIQAGMIVMITEGSIWKDTSWKLTTNNPIVLGTTALTFIQNTGDSYSTIIANGTSIFANAVSSAITFTPGNNFSIVGNATTDTVTFAVTDAPTFTGNVSGNYFIGNGSLLTGISSGSSNTIINGLSNVSIPVADGNVVITVNDSPQWIFNTNGTITLPTGSVETGAIKGQLSNQNWIAPSEGKVGLLSNDGNNTVYVNDSGINIETDTSNNSYTWNYDIFGNLTLPLGGNIYYSNGALYTTYSNTTVTTYGEAGWAGNIIPSANVTYSLGNATNQWASVYVGANTLYINNVAVSVNSANVLTVAGANVTTQNANGNITVGNISTSGNVSGGNITTAGIISAAGTITGNTTISAVGSVVAGVSLQAQGQTALYAAAAQNDSIGGNKTTGTIIIGGAAQTGTIQVGSSTGNQFVILAGGITGSGNTKTIQVGPAGAAGSTTTISVGPTLGNGTATFSANTTVAIANTSGTALSVAGNVTGGNITTAGLISATGSVIGAVISIPAGALTLTNQGSVNDVIAGTKNVGQVIIGGTTQTGTITVGQSTATQSLSLASGVTSSGNTKTISIGQSGASGSTTNITMGPSAGVGTVNIGSGTTMVIANTSGTALSVAGNVTGGNLSVGTGTVTLGNIVNSNGNGVGNIGSSSLYFNTVFAKATSAQYADLAEMYCADNSYPPGTVVEFGGEQEVTSSTTSHSTAVAGIVSTNPSYLMNSTLDCTNALEIALVGRVPCFVVGTIRKGDRLVASSISGVASALEIEKYQPGCIIGKSLENYDSDTVGVIEVAVGRF